MTTRGLARMFTRRKSALLAASAVVLISAGPAVAGSYTPGSSGAGDPYFPLAGNGVYDVSHYSLSLGYEPASKQLTGTAVITATATQNLSRFDLDLRGFTISKVQVNGSPAAYERAGDQELVITPSSGLRVGRSFTVSIAYAGVPRVVTDPDGSIEGWVPTADGAFVVGEPQGSPGWYPVNDTPQDKATFDFHVTVPEGLTVMANGVLVSHRSSGGRTTWVWRESDPMAPYLATATLGRFDLTVSHVGTIPSYVASDPTPPRATSSGSFRRSCSSTSRSTGPTRSTPSAPSRTTPRTWATRSRRRRSRSMTGCRMRRRLPTSRRTCGSETRSLSAGGRTSGSTRVSRRGRSGSGASTTARRVPRATSTPCTTPPPRRRRSGLPHPATRVTRQT